MFALSLPCCRCALSLVARALCSRWAHWPRARAPCAGPCARKGTLRAIAETRPPHPPPPEYRGELSVSGTSAQRAAELDAEARCAALEAQVAEIAPLRAQDAEVEVKTERSSITGVQAFFVAIGAVCALNARLWPWVRKEEEKLQISLTPACSLHSLCVPPPCRSWKQTTLTRRRRCWTVLGGVAAVVGLAWYGADLRKEVSGDIKALDSNLSGHIKALDKKLSGDIKALDKKLSGDIEALDSTFDRIDAQLDRIDAQLDRIDAKLERLLNRSWWRWS